MSSDGYRRFLESLKGGPDWRDGLDLAAFGEATPEEKKQLLDVLEQQLAAHSDARIPSALLATGGLESLPLILGALRRAEGPVSAAAGQTLLQMAFGEVSDALGKLVRDRQQGADARTRAMQVLQDVPGWDITYLFTALLDDPDKVVRLEAAEKVFGRVGLTQRPSDGYLGPRLLLRRLRSPIEVVSKSARDQLRKIADTSPPSSYQFPPQQPYSPELTSFMQSLNPKQPSIPVGALTGEERQLALTLLAELLAKGDLRAQSALAALPDAEAGEIIAEHAAQKPVVQA